MKNLKDSQTEKNLLAAFAGESQARNKYDYFAKEFKKAGYEQIAAIFAETALNEKEHAKREFKYLVKLGKLKEHLKMAIDGEYYERSEMYPEFARTAEKEGFKEIARMFWDIAKAEIAHEQRYRKLLKRLDSGTVFKDKKVVKWKCKNCGYIYQGREPPRECPACKHAKAYFERFCDNY